MWHIDTLRILLKALFPFQSQPGARAIFFLEIMGFYVERKGDWNAELILTEMYYNAMYWCVQYVHKT